jgi:mxaJ protein
VCADPNNLPFSNSKGEGFENRIAELVASRLKRRVEYIWWAQRRGFARNTLGAERCDLWPGVVSGAGGLATTRPYYRSSYVFVTRADRKLRISSFDDPMLRKLKVGVQMVGDDGANTPPAHALARRGITANVEGYMLYGDYLSPNPPAAIVSAVDRGDVDVAVVWGPLAGYFARRAQNKLVLTPLEQAVDQGSWPMAFDISMGLRKGDRPLLRAVDRALAELEPEVEAVLASYGVPQATPETAAETQLDRRDAAAGRNIDGSPPRKESSPQSPNAP